MAIDHIEEVWKHGPEDKHDRLVLLVLAGHADKFTGECYPSIERIAERAKISDRTVRRVVGRLDEEGWLGVDRGSGRSNTNVYSLNLRKLYRGEKDPPGTEQKGDTVSEKGDTVSRNSPEKGDTVSKKGDTVAPKPSRTVSNNEPSEEPRTLARARRDEGDWLNDGHKWNRSLYDRTATTGPEPVLAEADVGIGEHITRRMHAHGLLSKIVLKKVDDRGWAWLYEKAGEVVRTLRDTYDFDLDTIFAVMDETLTESNPWVEKKMVRSPLSLTNPTNEGSQLIFEAMLAQADQNNAEPEWKQENRTAHEEVADLSRRLRSEDPEGQ